MTINELDRTPITPGPAGWFTGRAWMEELGQLDGPTPTRVLRVTFTPGARTAWHSHPYGQVLHILEGIARIGREGQPVRELRAGDSVAFAPGERHWHGAVPSRLMTHIAVQAAGPDGAPETTWAEPVDDTQYAG
jgi:quercetin dioxygenase-like cupin family protein